MKFKERVNMYHSSKSLSLLQKRTFMVLTSLVEEFLTKVNLGVDHIVTESTLIFPVMIIVITFPQ